MRNPLTGRAARNTNRDERSVRAPRAAGALAPAGRPFLTLFIELLPNPLALQVRKVVDEQLPFEVIHLVLNADGQNVVVVAFEDFAVPVPRTDAYFRGALYVSEILRDRQTALFGDLLALSR